MLYRHEDFPDIQRMPVPDNFAYVVPVEEGYMLHSAGNPFCPIDPNCPCHEDELLIAEVDQFVQNGLMTPEEATDFVAGRML